MTATGTQDRLGPVVQYALIAGPLLTMLDSSVVNVAIEPITAELHATLTAAQWTVSAYLLALGTGLAGTSYLARRWGTLPVYRAGLIAFTLASAACAAAPAVGFLVAARVAQGLTGAPLVPLAMSMLRGQGAERGMSPVAGILLFLGPALGPTVGGGLIGVGGWRAIFLINLPVGALAALAASRVPAALAPGRTQGARFDLPGLVLLATGLTLLLFGINQAGGHGWASPSTWLPAGLGAALLVGYIRWAASRSHPALDLALARNRISVLALTLCALASVVTFAAVFLLPVFVQSVQGHSALATGLTLLPQGLITGVGTVLGRVALTRVSVRTTVLGGFSVLTAASLGLLGVDAHTPLPVTAAILAGRAASIGLVITPLLTVLTDSLRPDQLADANTLFNIWQRIAGSLGIGLIVALFSSRSHTRGPVTALHTVAFVITGLAAAAALIAVLLPARSEEEADRRA